MTASRERVALASFVAGALLAGGNGVSIRFSNRELPPLWGAGLRFSLAAALLLVVMAVLRLPVPRGRALTGALLYGALNFGAAFALAYYALLRLHAGLGQTLLALVPLATLLLAVAQRQERLRAAAVIGTPRRWVQDYVRHPTGAVDHPVDHPDDPTGPYWIRPDRRGTQPEQARPVWSRPGRRAAPGYGSGACPTRCRSLGMCGRVPSDGCCLGWSSCDTACLIVPARVRIR